MRRTRGINRGKYPSISQVLGVSFLLLGSIFMSVRSSHKYVLKMMHSDFIKPKQLGLLKDEYDEYINISNIKKGDKLYECHHSWGNIEMIALSDAQETLDGWTCRVKDRSDHEHEIFVSANTRHYGPNLFMKPQIIEQNEQGESGYYIQ